jgi:hypothetical protein
MSEVGAPAALSFEPIAIPDLRERWLHHHEQVLRSSAQTNEPVSHCHRALASLRRHSPENHEDCSFALRDALLECGHVDLAEHFKDQDHPKGCWALDLLLGRS